MTSPLLITKLHIPSPRPNLVPRPHLVHRLDEGLRLGRKLTLISAPAGFGKTTLLAEGDNDPARFLAYLVAALQTVEENIGAGISSALQAPQLLRFTPDEAATFLNRAVSLSFAAGNVAALASRTVGQLPCTP